MRWQWIAIAAAAMSLTACGDDGEASDGTTAAQTDDTAGTVTSLDGSSTGLADDTAGSTTDPDTGSTTDLPEPLPPLSDAPLTIERTIEPTHAVDDDPMFDPRIFDEREQMLAMGYGAFELGPGEPVLAITPDGNDPPAPGAGAGLITRFVHFADAQLADDESPTRVVGLDNPVISGGYRPQEAYVCRMVNATVRTINAVNAAMPIDFVVLGGDNADSAQTNEVQWFLGILDGAPVVHCDSGNDDDLVVGEDNDPKDRFAPVGLDMPWIWVTGNHDVLVQGNFVIQGREEIAIGDSIPGGGATIDWSTPGGAVFEGPVVPDPQRALLDGPALMSLIAESGDGHGISPEALADGRATYAWDVAGTDVRIVVVDTAAPTGAAEGLIKASHLEDRIRPLLDEAEGAGKIVIIATHHASTSLSSGGGLGGMSQPDALTTAEWQAFLGEYPNVIAHLCGHSHENRVRFIEPLGGHAYWELITPALVDWPNQLRVIEIGDEDNGWLTITTMGLDFATDDDPIAAMGRELGIVDFTGGWTPEARGELEDRNVKLWIAAP